MIIGIVNLVSIVCGAKMTPSTVVICEPCSLGDVIAYFNVCGGLSHAASHNQMASDPSK